MPRAAGHAGGDHRRQGHREPGSGHRAPRQGPRQVRRHDPRAWRRPRRREDRGKLGRAQRRPPDRRKPDWGPHGRAAPFRRNDELRTCCRRASSPSPAAASPRTSSTRQGSSAFRSAHRGLSRHGAASLRWRGPFAFAFQPPPCFDLARAAAPALRRARRLASRVRPERASLRSIHRPSALNLRRPGVRLRTVAQASAAARYARTTLLRKRCGVPTFLSIR